MAILTLVAKADAWIRSPASADATSLHLPVGRAGGETYRSLVDFPKPDYAGLHMIRINSAKLRLRTSSQVIVTRGATPRTYARRVIESWVASNVTWSNQPAATTDDEALSAVMATTDGIWIEISVTAIVRKWAPSTVQGGGGAGQRGFKLAASDESSTARTTEFTSRQSSYAPQLVIDYESNVAPEAPINLSPAGDDAIGAISGGLITFRGERVDPDPADYITAVEIAAHADAATDGAPGSVIVSGVRTYTTKPVTFAATLPASAFTVGTHYRQRARTRDKGGVWGPWSSFVDGRFIPDTVPGAPINLAVDSTSLTPHFFGSINDADPGAELGAVRILVYQDTTLGAVLKWDSGWDETSGVRFEQTYAGTPIEVGASGLRWAAATRDQYGAEGPLSGYQFWTPAAITGPSAMSPIDVETKQDTLTPTLTIGHSAAFDAHELEVARFADGSGVLWDVPVTTYASTSSKDVVYAGTALTWGLTHYWRARVRVAGTTWTEWSAWYPFYVNALPLAPVGSVDGAVDSGDHETITTATATLRFPFSDPDVAKGYAEAPTRREIEIEELDGTPFGASPFVITSAITDTFVTGTLTAETVYRTRARYDDSSDQRSPWSAYVNVKRSSAPAIAEDVAVDVADPNPTITWTFSSGPGKAQAAARIRVFDDATGELVHDSGIVATAATSYEIPGEILLDATDYRYEVIAYDTDLLSDQLDGGPWTTAFGTPNDLTGLVATADRGAGAIVLAWDESDLDPDYYWRYYIYRLDPATGTFVRIGEVDDIGTPAYTDLEAPHGGATYAVTVSNGWVESTPIIATATLSIDWFISDPNDASLAFELFITASRQVHANQQESHEPLGRTTPVIVSGELLAPAGTAAVLLTPDDVDTFDLLLRAAKVTPFVVFKDPFGKVRRVRIGSVTRDAGPAGSSTASFDYATVA